MEFFENLYVNHLQQETAWLAIIYICVLLAMFIDLVTGVRKASLNHQVTTSRGFRRTAEKAMQYLLPMLCLTCIDSIAAAFLSYPYLTASMGIFNIYIEIRSVWENTHSQKETEEKKKCAEDLEQFIKEHKEEIIKYIFKL